LVLIAQAVFFLEHGRTRRHKRTDKIAGAIDHRTHTSIVSVSNYRFSPDP